MISISQVKDRKEQAKFWAKARTLFAKDVCEHCAADASIIESTWSDTKRRAHPIAGDRKTIPCFASEVWALTNPFEEKQWRCGVYFEDPFAHAIRLAIDLAGTEALSILLEASEYRIQQWAWGHQVRPAPSIRDAFIKTLNATYDLEKSNGRTGQSED